LKTTVTDEQVQRLVETAAPFSLALLRWGPERFREGADDTEREHQRRMVALRSDGLIAILCPIASDSLCGLAILPVTTREAVKIMEEDPCVKAGMMTFDVLQCHGFPGDALPAVKPFHD
jgi:hypothetical protein